MARKKYQSRASRWEDACKAARNALDELNACLQDLDEIRTEYKEWRDNLPENFQGTALGEKLDAVADLDFSELECDALEEAENLELPLGFGRD